MLKQGVRDAWQRLCESRGGKAAAEDAAALSARLGGILKDKVSEQCRAHNPLGFEALAEGRRSRGAGRPSPPTGDQWALLNKVTGLLSLESSFSPSMMQNIESVANRLVEDLSSG